MSHQHEYKDESTDSTVTTDQLPIPLNWKVLVQGRISDFESYQKNVGIAKGLEQASEVINETLNKLNEEDE